MNNKMTLTEAFINEYIASKKTIEAKHNGIFDKKDAKSYIRDFEPIVKAIEDETGCLTLEYPKTGTLMNDNNVICYEYKIKRNTGADMEGICNEIKTRAEKIFDGSHKVTGITCTKQNNAILLSVFGPKDYMTEEKLEEHNDVVAVSQEKLAPSVQEFIKLFKEKKPEEANKIKDVYLIEVEGGWDITDCLIVLESGSTYKVIIPTENDGSVASAMGIKRTPQVKYVAPDFDMACHREQIDYVD